MLERTLYLLTALLMTMSAQAQEYKASTVLASIKTDHIPVIDGRADDHAWTNLEPISIYDPVADLRISLSSVYTDKEIYFLVRFPDPDESREHKLWTWDAKKQIYTLGNEREDVFVFKWNMGDHPVDLSIYGDEPYAADIWFWKACRTDPTGFADDKMHVLGSEEKRDATELVSRSGRQMFLLRMEDWGKGAYKTNLQVKFVGEKVSRYQHQNPSGSRADVRAKGIWEQGFWTIEFARALNTGNDDDVQFDITRPYELGISRYEIAGRKKNHELSQPLYGKGDVGEKITLIFQGSMQGKKP